MPLDEALRMLLHLEPEQPESGENGDGLDPGEDGSETEAAGTEKKEESGDEPGLTELERAIGEIEAVADADMVRKLAEEKEKKMRMASSRAE